MNLDIDQRNASKSQEMSRFRLTVVEEGRDRMRRPSWLYTLANFEANAAAASLNASFISSITDSECSKEM